MNDVIQSSASSANGNAPKTLFVFVDGLGMGPRERAVNPLLSGSCPHLQGLMDDVAVPVDATLDVPGIPQSATGQTTLLTGINGARLVGRHQEACPGPRLRAAIRQRNLFDLLIARGYLCAFANAYYLKGYTAAGLRKRRSVTTVMTLKSLGFFRTVEDMERGEAVYNDLTRDRLVERGYAGRTISPECAAEHLVHIAEQHDLTLFEYFQTDVVAHKGTADDVRRILARLDRFLKQVSRFADGSGRLFILLSDHGNIEDATTRGHTRNPVPLIALGHGAAHLRSTVARLEDFVPEIMTLYPARRKSATAACEEELS